MSARVEYGVDRGPDTTVVPVGPDYGQARTYSLRYGGEVVVRDVRRTPWVPLEEHEPVRTIPILDGTRQIGSIVVTDAGHDRWGYIVWEVLEEYRGRGHVSTALRNHLPSLLTRWHRLVAVIRPGNEESMRLAEAVGFEAECVQRRARFIDGGWEDTHLYVMLAPEEAPDVADPDDG